MTSPLLPTVAPAPAAPTPAPARPAEGSRNDSPSAPGSFQRWLAQSQERATRDRLAAQRAADTLAATARAPQAAADASPDADASATRPARAARDADRPEGTAANGANATAAASASTPTTDPAAAGRAGPSSSASADAARRAAGPADADGADAALHDGAGRSSLRTLGGDGPARGASRSADGARAARAAAQRAGEDGTDAGDGRAAAAGRDFADLLAGAPDATGRPGLPGGPTTGPGAGSDRLSGGAPGDAAALASGPVLASAGADSAALAGASTTAPAGATDSPALPPPAEAYVAARPDQPAFAQAVGAQVSLWVRDGVQEARLHLNPPEMGPVTVHIAMDGASARVEFAADVAATRHAIERSLPELATALRDSGLTLAGGGVFDQPRGRDGSQTPAEGPASGDRTTTPTASSGLPAPTLGSRPRGLVDLVA